MDLWVIAAAAGAGYVAKNLQNFSVDKKESLGGNSLKYSYDVQSESRNFLQQLRDKTCPLRRLAQQRVEDNVFVDVYNNSLSSEDREDGAASISGQSLQERLEFEDGGNRNFSRGKLVKDRRRVHPMRPLNSLGSCLENMEQRDISPSVCTVRPVLVTDGRWGNTSSNVDFDGCKEEVKRQNAASSSSSSKQFESVEGLRKPKKSSSNLQQNGYGDARSTRSQGPETMLLFITGMTIGVLSATWFWKNEVDKLNKELKQMDNLVQDLHEELDMKEMLMVKELSDEDGLPSASISSPVEKIDELNKFYSLKTNEKNAENLELLSRIEEELEAELEMLEKNMKVSAIERLSSVVEIDPDFEPEIVQGDLKATMLNDASKSGTETDATTNVSKPANYAVSPAELSLRLHELIKSRLEARIKELEIELGNSQNMISGRRFSYSETESSSTHQSPTCICSAHDKLQEDASTYKGNNGILHKVIDTDQEKKAGEYRSKTLVQDMQQLRDKQRGTSFIYNEDSTSEDEGSDESDMLLIKQIVERRKSCSSFNLRIG